MLNEEIVQENHEDRLREIAMGFQEDDAKIVLDIFVQRFPTLVFRSLHERFMLMTKTSTDMKATLNDIYGYGGMR